MKILITGGCGFVGSNLGLHLKKESKLNKITSLDNLSRNGSKLNLNRLKKNKINNLKIDITKNKAVQKLPRYDIIIDCCAEPAVEASKKKLDKVFYTNLVGTFNILKKCVKDKSSLIFLSSSRVYSIENLYKIKKTKTLINESFDTQNAKSIYGYCKHSSEQMIKEFSYLYKMKYIINRFGVISGPWQFGKQDQGFVSLWLWKHINKKKLTYIGFGGKGNQVRDVIHINDVCELISLQIKKIKSLNNLIINVGGGLKNSVSLRKLTKICQDITSNKIKMFSKKKTSEYDIPYYVTNNSKVKRIYHWKPKYNFLKIIEDIYKWMIANRKILKRFIK